MTKSERRWLCYPLLVLSGINNLIGFTMGSFVEDISWWLPLSWGMFSGVLVWVTASVIARKSMDTYITSNY